MVVALLLRLVVVVEVHIVELLIAAALLWLRGMRQGWGSVIEQKVMCLVQERWQALGHTVGSSASPSRARCGQSS